MPNVFSSENGELFGIRWNPNQTTSHKLLAKNEEVNSESLLELNQYIFHFVMDCKIEIYHELKAKRLKSTITLKKGTSMKQAMETKQ